MKRKARVLRGALALALASGAGCSLVVDASEIDAGCPPLQKFCGGDCVAVDDPAYGCTLDLCEPCTAELHHAIPHCVNEQCVARVCLEGFGCDRCSINIFTDERNCGACNNACPGGHICESGVCVENDLD